MTKKIRGITREIAENFRTGPGRTEGGEVGTLESGGEDHHGSSWVQRRSRCEASGRRELARARGNEERRPERRRGAEYKNSVGISHENERGRAFLRGFLLLRNPLAFNSIHIRSLLSWGTFSRNFRVQ
jgi:hypothetical protein